MGRKRPVKHTVHTKHPRYNTSQYPRGRGQQTLGGGSVNSPLRRKREIGGLRIQGRVGRGDGSTVTSEKEARGIVEQIAKQNSATIILEKAKYKTGSDEPPKGRYLNCWRFWHDPYDNEVKVVTMKDWNTPEYQRARLQRFNESEASWVE